MTLHELAKRELEAKSSPRAYCSQALNEQLKEGVRALMLARGMGFADTARLIGEIDASGFRKWLQNARVRIRSAPGGAQTLGLGKALLVAAWLDDQASTSDSAPADAPPSADNAVPADHLNFLLDVRASGLGLGNDQEIAADIGVSALKLAEARSGGTTDPAITRWLTAPLLPSAFKDSNNADASHKSGSHSGSARGSSSP